MCVLLRVRICAADKGAVLLVRIVVSEIALGVVFAAEKS